MFRSFVLAALVTFPVPATAHVMFAPDTATTNTTYVGALRVTHGCDGAATTQIRVTIPDGVNTAKPQAKPGWTITVERTPLTKPVPGKDGKMVTDRVNAIIWQGNLPDDQFDDFVLMLKMPAAGAVYFPVTQTCGTVTESWTTIPAAAQGWHDTDHPAPVLTVQPAMSGDMHGQM